MRKFKCLQPSGFGLPSDYNLVFEQTKKGYKSQLPNSEDGTWNWIGMPAVIIENEPHLFEELPTEVEIVPEIALPKPKRARIKPQPVLIPKHK